MNEEKTKKRTSKIVTIIIADIIIFTSIWLFYYISKRPNPPGRNIECISNLKLLGIGFAAYAMDNANSYPNPENWCDLIKPYLGQRESDNFFQCPSSEKGEYYYAMNPNCEPNSLPDTVLLFETKESIWNLSGGPELLTTENHTDHRCRVLYNNYSFGVINKEDIDNLKWNDEEKEND